MERFYFDEVIGQCCKRVPQYFVRFAGGATKKNRTIHYAVLLCPVHLNQNPYEKNILLIKDLDSIELVNVPREENENA